MRAYSRRLIAFVIQALIILLLTFGLSFSAGHSLAQDATADPSDPATVIPTDVPTDVPTVAPTDVPTEAPTDIPTVAPTDVPTDAPTEEVTSAPTEAVTEQPSAAPTEAAATDVPTQNPTQPPATQASPDVFTQDFQDGQTSAWLLTAGWAIADEAGNKILTASTPNEMATLTGVAWPYYTLSVRVRGDIQFNMTASGSSYQIKIAADGAASLLKDGTLIGQVAGAPATDATVEPAANWHTVNLLAPGNLLAVKVDNFTPISTTDASLVGMGPLMVGTSTDNASSVAFDDLSIQRLDAPPPVPTAVPTDGGVVPLPTAITVTEEPTVEVTSEPTVEATSEATAEATVEATSEATAEATSEATAEATVEPFSLSEEALKKLPSELIDILQTYAAGDVAGAKAAAADYFIATDEQQRISVTVWTTNEQAAAKTAANITASKGLVTDALSIRLQASVTLEELIALVKRPEVTFIEVPPRAVSTSNMQAPNPGGGFGTGGEISEAVDTTGAAAWQNAAVKGANVNIAVIDTGFGPSLVSGPEYTCLGNTALSFGTRAAGDINHGLQMVQVLCDMAPLAKVFMYKATEQTSLTNALNAAAASNKVIVIAMDLGASVSPGDGTGGGVINGLYTAITAARNAGKIVIASAGNNTGRYVTLNYTGASATLGMTLYAGDTVHVVWDDWGNTGKNVPSNLTGTFAPPQGTRGGNPKPVYTYIVPAGTCAGGCSDEVLTFPAGGSTGTVQVQITGKGTIDDTSGAPVSTSAGNIARPADSQDLIAVGAVCPDSSFNLNLDSSSSHGPIFAAGGGAPTAVAPFTRDQVKPDLVGPTHVSTTLGSATNQGGCDSSGFNGTSAAAAHVAGMVALLVSNSGNNSMAAFRGTTSAAVDAVQNYLQTHTIDKTSVPGFGVGYDNSYGAGYTQLGSPTYDLNQVTAINTDANQLPASCSSTTPRYVGLNNPGSSQDGTLTNPYIDINEALANAAANQCVVVLPGEYVSPIVATSTTLAPAILSYDAATSFIASPSKLWSVILPPIFIDANGLVVDGFTAQNAFTLTYAGGTAIHPTALRLRNPTGAVIQNNSFSGFKAPGTITSTVSTATSAQILNNSFTNFVISSSIAGPITLSESDTAVLEIRGTGVNDLTGAVTGTVVISNNNFSNNSITATNGIISTWQSSLVGAQYSNVDIFDNRFQFNSTGSLIGVNQSKNSPGSTLSAGEIRIFGNLFNTNTNNGPLIHLFKAPLMRFVNNTVINNTMSAADDFDAYFDYGLPNVDSGGRQMEIVNNLFYNNGPVQLGLVSNLNSHIGCEPIPLGSFNAGNPLTYPVRNNWFSPLITDTTGYALGLDECVGRASGTITDPITPATFFGADADPTDPYRLRPNTITIPSTKGGINTGDNTGVTDIFGADLSNVFDLIGTERKIIGRNDTAPWTTTDAVDIGAYELGQATPPVIAPNPITLTIDEDSAPSVVFQLKATGGYSRFFSITAPPTIYDTNKANACGGQPVAFSKPNIVTYCPPANFHTFYGPSGSNVPIVIGFSVEDKIGNPGVPDNGTIVLTINPVNDGAPTANPINAVTDYGSPINYQLGPAAAFSPNFSLLGSANGKDYQATFTYIGHDAANGAGDNLGLFSPNTPGTQAETDAVLMAAFNQANTDTVHPGLLVVNPVGKVNNLGDNSGIGRYHFTYSITDQDGQPSGTGHGVFTVVPLIAQDGHYDDDSFYVTYTGAGWTPSYAVSAAYNHTLHSTKAATNQLEFPFSGTVVSLNMLGTSLPNATTRLKVQFNVDKSGNIAPKTYAEAQAYYTAYYAGLNPPQTSPFSCINTLNGQQPDGNSTILNYSAINAAYKLICSGFPAGSVQSIILTNNLATAAMTLDSMDVGSGILKPGLYQENDINITYIGPGWKKQANASALGGSRTFATGIANSYTFQIKNAARFVLYTSPGPTGGTMQVCITPAGGIQTCNNRSDFHAGTVLYKQQQAFTGLDPNLVYTVAVTNVTPATGYIDLDAVQVFAPTAALTPATPSTSKLYQQDDANITYNGSGWITQAAAAASGGSRIYATGAANTYSFQVTGATRFTLYTSPSLTGGTMRVCIAAGAIPNCYNRSENSSVALWQQKQVFDGLDSATLYTVTVSNISPVATQYIDLDAIDVFGTTSPLGLGLYQQENPNITYIGAGWKLSSAPAFSGGSDRYSYTVGDSYKFQITGAGRFVLYTSPKNDGGSMQVCIAPLPPNVIDGCSPPRTNNNIAAVYQQQQVFAGLDSGTQYTITVTNVSSPATPPKFIDLDAIQVLPDIQPLTPSVNRYEQNYTNIIYSGFGWQNVASASASGGSYRQSSVVGNSYTFQVQGADRFALYVSPRINGGTMSVTCKELDNNGMPTGPNVCIPATASENAGAAQFQQPRYFIGFDSAKTYQITVANNSVGANRIIDLDAIEVNGPLAPLTPGASPATPGFYQQNDINIRYTGAGWKTVSNINASGGSYKNTVVSGNKYEFQVQGATGFALYVSPSLNGGTMSVTCKELVAGVPTGGNVCTPATASETSNATLWQQQKLFTGLTPGNTYLITVTKSSPAATNTIDLDAILVLGAVEPLIPSLALYQQDNPNITYTGAGWLTQANPGALGGSYKKTSALNNKYEFQVQGADRFALYVSPTTTGGTMQVCIVPTPTGGTACPDASNNRNNAAGTAQFQQPRFFGGLTPATLYTVTVTNIVAGKSIDLDAIEVMSPIQALMPNTLPYQENNQNIAYTGNGWARATSPLFSGSNQRTTTGLNNSYQFKVSGADRFVLFVSTGSMATSDMQVCIDDGVTPTCSDISTVSIATLYQQPRYFTGLTPGSTYTITVKNLVAGKSLSLDAIRVDAPIANLAIGPHDQADPNIRYTGLGWTLVNSTNAYFNSYRSTTTIGSSYTFQFTGADRFVIYTSRNTTGGKMQVCITDVTAATAPTCSDRFENAGTPPPLWQQPQFFSGLTPGDTYSVTVKNTSPPPVPPAVAKYIDIDKIEILAPPTALGVGSYEENNANITYVGAGWTKGTPAAASGKSYLFSKGNGDSYSFQVKEATRFALWLTPSNTGGTMSVTCVEMVGGVPTGGSVCTPGTASDFAPVVAPRFQQAKIFTGLDKTKIYKITVTNISALATQYIDLDAIQVGDKDAPATLTAGWYQDTDLNLTYTGTWAQDPQGGASGGQTTVSKTNGDTLTFTFTGTGFTIFTYSPPSGAPMNICYTPNGGTQVCTPAPIPTAANPALGNVGYAVYGLKQGTYSVTITNVGATTTQGLYIDRIAILDTPPNILTAGTYENSSTNAGQPNIVYSPASLWTTPTNVNYSGTTISTTPNKGATAQIRFVGTTLIIYQAVGPTNSRNVLLCRVVSGPVSNPPPQCGSFSQNTPAVAYKVPIAFYGFGSGTNEVVIENRNQGGSLNIDKIMVN